MYKNGGANRRTSIQGVEFLLNIWLLRGQAVPGGVVKPGRTGGQAGRASQCRESWAGRWVWAAGRPPAALRVQAPLGLCMELSRNGCYKADGIFKTKIGRFAYCCNEKTKRTIKVGREAHSSFT